MCIATLRIFRLHVSSQERLSKSLGANDRAQHLVALPMWHSALSARPYDTSQRSAWQQVSPGVKTPDSLRALKMESASAVRLGSRGERK